MSHELLAEPRRGSWPQPTVAPEQRAAPGATVGFESNHPINLGEVVARRCESAGAWRNLNWGEVRSLSHQLLPEPRRGSQPQPTIAPEQRAAPGATVGLESNHQINLGEVVAVLRIGRGLGEPELGEVRSLPHQLLAEPRRGSQPQPTVAPEERAAPGATVGFESPPNDQPRRGCGSALRIGRGLAELELGRGPIVVPPASPRTSERFTATAHRCAQTARSAGRYGGF